MKKTILWLSLVTGFVVFCTLNCTAQKRLKERSNAATYSYINKGDSSLEVGDYPLAESCFFKAKELGKISREHLQYINSRILFIKKYYHFEALMRNAKQLENSNQFIAAEKFYEDAYQYAEDEDLIISDSLFSRMQTIHQLMEIFALLDKSKEAERHNDFAQTQKYFIDAVEKAELVSNYLEENSFSPAIKMQLDSMLQFMVFKNDTTLNYHEFFTSHYKTLQQILQGDLIDYLNTLHTLPTCAIRFISSIDSTGLTHTTLSSNNIPKAYIINDENILHQLQKIGNTIELQQPHIHGFSMPAIAEFYCILGKNEYFARIRKNFRGYRIRISTDYDERLNRGKKFRLLKDEYEEEKIRLLTKNFPDGQYFVKICTIEQNNSSTTQLSILRTPIR